VPIVINVFAHLNSTFNSLQSDALNSHVCLFHRAQAYLTYLEIVKCLYYFVRFHLSVSYTLFSLVCAQKNCHNFAQLDH